MKWAQRQTGLIVFVAVCVFAAGAPVCAELGGSINSVQADQVRMNAGLRRIALATHVRHELALPNGGAVHEYTNPQGQVFAIRWSGPGKPDLRSLLGRHFDTFQAANVSQSSRFGRFSRRPLEVERADLQIRSGGHMGYFWGLAWLPALMPAGVRPGDLQ